jgi:hypothetical protein
VIFGRYLCPRFHTTSGDERACWAGTSDTQRPHAWKAPGKRCARPQAPEIPIGACRQSESDKCDKELGLVAADLGKVPPRASNRSMHKIRMLCSSDCREPRRRRHLQAPVESREHRLAQNLPRGGATGSRPQQCLGDATPMRRHCE